MDDLGLWRRPLVPSEVTQLFAAVKFGCTDPMSCNFNPEAEEDDGSCLPYDSTSGCTDSVACNYNSNALCDDGSCIYPPLNLANCDDGGGDLRCWNILGHTVSIMCRSESLRHRFRRLCWND